MSLIITDSRLSEIEELAKDNWPIHASFALTLIDLVRRAQWIQKSLDLERELPLSLPETEIKAWLADFEKFDKGEL